MGAYIFKRLLLMIPTMFLVLAVVFFGMRILPTDITDVIMESAPFGGSAVIRDALRRELNLDKPLLLQFGIYTSQLLRGDLGVSAYDRRPVADRITNALPTTLQLAAMAMIISVFVALFAGTVSAVFHEKIIDQVIRVLSIVMFSAPSFWIATMVIVFPAMWWGYFPPLFYTSFTSDPLKNLQQFLPPAIILGLSLAGAVTRMVRSSLLEVLRQDYVRTARAKGLRDWVLLVRHALPNGLIPVIAFIGLQVSAVLGGAVVIETIFALPGIGLLVLTAVFTKDYPVIQGTVLVFGVIVAMVNLITDISYRLVDPRVQYG